MVDEFHQLIILCWKNGGDQNSLEQTEQIEGHEIKDFSVSETMKYYHLPQIDVAHKWGFDVRFSFIDKLDVLGKLYPTDKKIFN